MNEQKSIELVKTVLQEGRSRLIEKWLKDDNIQYSKEPGVLIIHSGTGMALSVHLCVKYHSNAVNCFVQRGEYNKIVP